MQLDDYSDIKKLLTKSMNRANLKLKRNRRKLKNKTNETVHEMHGILAALKGGRIEIVEHLFQRLSERFGLDLKYTEVNKAVILSALMSPGFGFRIGFNKYKIGKLSGALGIYSEVLNIFFVARRNINYLDGEHYILLSCFSYDKNRNENESVMSGFKRFILEEVDE